MVKATRRRVTRRKTKGRCFRKCPRFVARGRSCGRCLSI